MLTRVDTNQPGALFNSIKIVISVQERESIMNCGDSNETIHTFTNSNTFLSGPSIQHGRVNKQLI